MSIVDRLRKDGSNGPVGPPNDEAFAKAYPLLWEMLTVSSYRRGEDRILPEIKVRRISGAYEVLLLDHETCQQVSAIALTWADLPQALETALGAGLTPWRAFKSYVNPKGLKRHDKKGS